jgi:hypothetical protein
VIGGALRAGGWHLADAVYDTFTEGFTTPDLVDAAAFQKDQECIKTAELTSVLSSSQIILPSAFILRVCCPPTPPRKGVRQETEGGRAEANIIVLTLFELAFRMRLSTPTTSSDGPRQSLRSSAGSLHLSPPHA